jgi:hypothetical protein
MTEVRYAPKRDCAVQLPVEIYSRERIAEFDAAESDLAQVLEEAARSRK